MGDFSKKLLGIFLGISLSLGVGVSLSNSVHREAVGAEAASTSYEKITSTDQLIDGKYLIVCESKNVAFDGSLTTLDASGNTKSVTITSSKIDVASDDFYFVWNSTEGSLKSASGYYIYRSKKDNGLDSTNGSAPSCKNTITFDDKGVLTIASSEATLKYNSASDQTRFRYYKSGQTAIQLYKEKATPNIDLNYGSVDPTALITNKTYSFTYECNELCGSNPTVIFEVEKDYSSKIALTQDETAKKITINTGTALTTDTQFNVVCYVLDESGDYLVNGKTFTFKVLMPTLTLSKEEVALRTEDEVEVSLTTANFDGDVTYSAKIDEGYPTNITYEISGNKLTITGASADETIIDVTATDGTRTATAALYVTVVDKIVKGKTVQELIKQTSDNKTLYEVTAVVTSITNTEYGNLYLKDSSVSSGDGLYVYGCTATASAFTDNGIGYAYTFKNPKDHNSNELTKSIVVGSRITMYGIVFDYKSSSKTTREMQGIVTSVVSPQEQADAFGTYFLNATSTACADVTTPDANKAALEEIWANISSYYNNIDNLSDAAKALVKNATANNEGTDLEKAMARYDTIMNRYEASSNIIDNFINRSTSSAQKSPFRTSHDNNSLVLIISIISFLSVTSFGAFTFIKRRKTN